MEKRTFILVLMTLLLGNILLRIGITYFTPTGHLTIPDYYFAMERIGHDWHEGIYVPAVEIFQRSNTHTPSYYGTAFSAILAPFLALCSPVQSMACSDFFYRIVMGISILLLTILAFMIPKNVEDKIICILLLTNLLLGVSGSRALETGNIDLLFSAVFTLIVYSAIHRRLHPFVGSILAGVLANTKIYILPLAVCIAFCTRNARWFLVALLLTSLWFSGFSLTPFTNATASLPRTWQQLFSYGPGNNAITSIASAPSSFFHLSSEISVFLSFCLTVVLIVFLFIWPWYGVAVRPFTKRSILPVLSICITALSVLPPVSFDYRLVYPLVFSFLTVPLYIRKEARRYVYLAVLALVTHGLWIKSGKLMMLPLLLFCYFNVKAAVLELSR